MEGSLTRVPRPPASTSVGRVVAAGAAVILVAALALRAPDDLVGQLTAFAAGLPAIVASGFLAAKRPVLTVAGVMALGAFAGTLATNQGFAPKYTEALIWVLLLGLLAALVAGRLNHPTASTSIAIWPGIAALGAYVALTAIQIPFAETQEIGIKAFIAGPAFIAAFFALAYSNWTPEVRWRIAQAFVLVALVVGAYALFRWITGPTGAELAVTRSSGGVAGELSLIGSFGSRFQLGAWSAVAMPFLFALTLGTRGRWRWLSAAALALMIVALLGSEVRTALIGAALGIGVAAVLYHGARAFRGEGVAAILAITALAVAGIAGFALTVGSDTESRERFERIFTPGEDDSFQARLVKWDVALAEINEHPLGQGLGTTGATQRLYSRTYRIDNRYIDNSYLQLGTQQGYPGWILFGLSVVLIAYMLVRSSLAAGDRRVAILGIGAAASLASWMIVLFNGEMLNAWGTMLLWMLLGLGVGGLVSTRRRTVPPARSDGL